MPTDKKDEPSDTAESQEWENVKDLTERRKIQNKIAQRKFREF